MLWTGSHWNPGSSGKVSSARVTFLYVCNLIQKTPGEESYWRCSVILELTLCELNKELWKPTKGAKDTWGKSKGLWGEKDIAQRGEWSSAIQFLGGGCGVGGRPEATSKRNKRPERQNKQNSWEGQGASQSSQKVRGHLGSDQSEQTNLPEFQEHRAGFRRATHHWCPLERKLAMMILDIYTKRFLSISLEVQLGFF